MRYGEHLTLKQQHMRADKAMAGGIGTSCTLQIEHYLYHV